MVSFVAVFVLLASFLLLFDELLFVDLSVDTFSSLLLSVEPLTVLLNESLADVLSLVVLLSDGVLSVGTLFAVLSVDDSCEGVLAGGVVGLVFSPSSVIPKISFISLHSLLSISNSSSNGSLSLAAFMLQIDTNINPNTKIILFIPILLNIKVPFTKIYYFFGCPII